MDLFSEEMRRNPYPAYDRMRNAAPLFHHEQFGIWMIFDFAGVKQALMDHEAFSSDLSHVPGSGNPGEWFIFFDPPRHTRLRALIAKAFTPRVVMNLEPRIRELSRQSLVRDWTATRLIFRRRFRLPSLRSAKGVRGKFS